MTNALLFDKVKRMKTVKLSSKNQIVIPRTARQTMGITGGDTLVIKKVTATEVILQKQPSYAELLGTLPAQKADASQRVRSLRDNWK